MSKPRHQSRGSTSRSDSVKIRLRLPTDGSVDLDKLRAALEAQLERQVEPVIEEPVVVQLEPEKVEESVALWGWLGKHKLAVVAGLCLVMVAVVAIALVAFVQSSPSVSLRSKWVVISFAGLLFLALSSGSAVLWYALLWWRKQEPSEARLWIKETWLWIKAKGPAVVALFSGVLTLVMGIFSVAAGAVGGGTGGMILIPLVTLSVCVGAFSVVIRRQLAIPDSSTAVMWNRVRENPKWIYIPSLSVVGLVLLVVWAISLARPTPGKQPDDLAKGKPKVETVSEPFKLPEGFGARMMVVLLAGGALGFSGFQLRRKVGATTVQTATAAHIDFWPGFRHFVAAQGGYLLVAAATGAAVLAWDSTRYIYEVNGQDVGYSILSAFLWALPGMGLAGLLLLALGASGVNLMPALDRTLNPAIGGSAILRFIKRKLPHIIFMGIVFGAFVSVWRVEPIGVWISYWFKWTLSIGLVVAAFWNKGKLGEKVENVRPLPKIIRTKLSHVMNFNMPLVAGLTLPVAFGILVITGAAWVNVGWIAPLAGLGIFLGASLLMNFPRLLRHWQEIIFFPGIVALICDWLVWGNSFWFVFSGLTVLFAFGKVMTQPKDIESGRLLVFLRSSREYRPVIFPNQNGVQIRWGSLVAVVSFTLIMLVAAGKWLWSGGTVFNWF